MYRYGLHIRARVQAICVFNQERLGYEGSGPALWEKKKAREGGRGEITELLPGRKPNTQKRMGAGRRTIALKSWGDFDVNTG